MQGVIGPLTATTRPWWCENKQGVFDGANILKDTQPDSLQLILNFAHMGIFYCSWIYVQAF